MGKEGGSPDGATTAKSKEQIAVARCAVRGVLDFKDPGLLRRQLVRSRLSRLGLLGQAPPKVG